ncbi:unnamed protein product [Adineta ricciae]|uniref:HAT C-terminal dimerisation domain-containing protein n=1 Tax=Adineta ricciae TaxID=249248 RepID=A0A814Z3H1_ADIRI|nr:unnamed protein product [Adineta ricciae]CAF1488701.1 unnamed protein product [Adineta ricciae]
MTVERHLKQKNRDQTNSQPTTTMSSSTSTSSSSTNENSSIRKPDLLQIFLKSVGKHAPTRSVFPKTLSEEFTNYAHFCKNEKAEEAVSFWRKHGEQMPLLKALAQQYLATPGTSVPSESAFSTSAYVGRKERARLSPENLSYTVFLKDKLQSS